MIKRKQTSKFNPKIRSIQKKLMAASQAYYNDNQSIMTDQDFDRLKDKLQQLDPHNPFLRQIGAPVRVSQWKKAKHKRPMTSLNKVNTVDEFRKWANDIGGKYFLIEDKLDGISINFEYQNGDLVKAITRGDGEEGEDIFANAKKMKNVRLKIDNFTGSNRGEIFLLQEDFEKINQLLRAKGEKELSNPRNSASGIAKRLNGTFSEYLTVLFYDVESPNVSFTSESDKISCLRNLGLEYCFIKKVTVDEAVKVYEDYEEKLRAETPYDIDGLVIKADDMDLQRKHGMLGGRPKAQIAWKFESIKKEATTENVKWHMGRNRRVTPILNIGPTEIGGVIVRNVSLHNLSIFKKLKIGKGDTVLIARRNDVIPYCEGVIKSKGNYFEVPTKCTVCKSDLEEEGKFLICPNDTCEGLDIGCLHKWIYSLDIKDIGPSIIDALYQAKKIKDPSDFYRLVENDISGLDRLGVRSAQKILKHLNDRKELTLPEFIGGLNMSNFATRTAESVVDAGYDTIDKMLSLTENTLVQIQGIESKTANQIVSGLKNKADVIKRLIDVGITFKKKVKKQVKSTKLSGKSFCFTGAIQKIDDNGNRFSRGMMEDLVLENGGTVGSVKKGLTFLVTASTDSASSKMQKAKNMGVQIISEKEFFDIIDK